MSRSIAATMITSFLIAMLLVVFCCEQADAFRRQTTVTGPGGRSATKTTSGYRAPGYGQRSTTVTGPNGKSVTGNTEVYRSPGSYSANTTVTGPGGRSATSSTTASRNQDGVGASTTVTGPSGYQVHRNSQGSWDAETQTWNRDVTTTGPQGNSYTTNRSTSIRY